MLALLAAFRGEPAGPASLAELEAMHAGGALDIVGAAAADMTEWAKGVCASNAARPSATPGTVPSAMP